jgi:16S rRNA (guanine527-N7)-methyltransferase
MSDSLALLELPELQAAQGRWADLGAGAGIPGLPLAVAMPAASVVLVESVAKKCQFLREAVIAAGVHDRVDVVCLRSEEYAAKGATGRRAFGLVLARAVGPLPVVLELAAPLAAPNGRVLISTSEQRAASEWRAAATVAARCGLLLDRVEALTRSPLSSSVCVVARALETLPDWLPRRPGRARSHPLARS